MIKSFIKTSLLLIFFLALVPFSTDGLVLDSVERMFVEPSYDKQERRTISAKLQAVTNSNYFFVDNEWWDELTETKKAEYEKAFYNLGKEFESHIYPKTRDIFGTMPVHSVTKDNKKLTVLFHPMRSGAGGYFRTGDQYSIYRYSRSNERNIVYLNAEHILDDNIASYLAHEHMHLVTFNQKNVKHGVNEEVWLNELRSEIIISLLGYNKKYEGSNLENRVYYFLRDPDISLTEWTEQVADYGVINLFGHYVLDHYGEKIFIDSLQSNKIGILSIDYALEKNDIVKTFEDIFVDFAIAVYLNDCSYGEYYCYQNKHLRDVKIYPAITVIASTGTPHTINYQTKSWLASWHEIIVEDGDLHLDFTFNRHFIVSYLLCKENGDCYFRNIPLDRDGKGSLFIEDFNSHYKLMTIIPILGGRRVGFNGPEETTIFVIQAELKDAKEEREKRQRNEVLKRRLEVLTEKVERLYNQLKQGVFSKEKVVYLENNLYYGMSGSQEVEVLQRFLKEEGVDVYPEGLVTGNFYDRTKRAVIRLQEKYSEKILAPLGLFQGTGFVGKYTRDFINSRIK